MIALKMIRLTGLVLTFMVIAGCSKQDPSAAKPSEATPPPVTNGSEPTKPSKGTLPVPPKGAEAEGPKEFRETAESLTSAFEANYSAAVKKYAGKIVEVTGPFVEVFPNNTEGEPQWRLWLRGCRDSGGYARLYIKVTDRQIDSDPRLQALARGQSVTARGKVQDNRDVSLTDCTVVRVGPSTAIPTTLQEIEAEVGKGKGFGRFKDRDVLVRVTLAGSELKFTGTGWSCYAQAPKGSQKSFEFQGLRLTEAYDKELTALKPGDTVLFLATLTEGFASRPSEIEFSGTRLLKALPEGLKLPEVPK